MSFDLYDGTFYGSGNGVAAMPFAVLDKRLKSVDLVYQNEVKPNSQTWDENDVVGPDETFTTAYGAKIAGQVGGLKDITVWDIEAWQTGAALNPNQDAYYKDFYTWGLAGIGTIPAGKLLGSYDTFGNFFDSFDGTPDTDGIDARFLARNEANLLNCFVSTAYFSHNSGDYAKQEDYWDWMAGQMERVAPNRPHLVFLGANYSTISDDLSGPVDPDDFYSGLIKLETLVDGVILWDAGTFDPTEGWYQALLTFLDTQESSLKIKTDFRQSTPESAAVAGPIPRYTMNTSLRTFHGSDGSLKRAAHNFLCDNSNWSQSDWPTANQDASGIDGDWPRSWDRLDGGQVSEQVLSTLQFDSNYGAEYAMRFEVTGTPSALFCSIDLPTDTLEDNTAYTLAFYIEAIDVVNSNQTRAMINTYGSDYTGLNEIWSNVTVGWNFKAFTTGVDHTGVSVRIGASVDNGDTTGDYTVSHMTILKGTWTSIDEWIGGLEKQLPQARPRLGSHIYG